MSNVALAMSNLLLVVDGAGQASGVASFETWFWAMNEE
jgi:hypothetical protein